MLRLKRHKVQFRAKTFADATYEPIEWETNTSTIAIKKLTEMGYPHPVPSEVLDDLIFMWQKIVPPGNIS